MIRPLRKRDSNGKAYERPAEIEAALEIADNQDLGELQRRGEISDKKSTEFLRSECLVYLIREARRGGDDESMNGLLPILLRRCAANLKRKVPEGSLPNAAEVREEILSGFSVLFAEDGQADHLDVLDFYECHFNQAFRALRITDRISRVIFTIRESIAAANSDTSEPTPWWSNALRRAVRAGVEIGTSIFSAAQSS